MSEILSSLQISWEGSSSSRLIFVAMKPLYAIDGSNIAEADVFRRTNEESLSTLLKSDSLTFVRNLISNESLIKFLESFCAHRSKAIISGNGGIMYPFATSLEMIDRKVLQLVHRILFSDLVAVMAAYAKMTPRLAPLSADEAYCRMLIRIPICNVNNIMGCIGAWGLANAPLTGPLLLQLSKAHPHYQTDFSAAVTANVKATRQIQIDAKVLEESFHKAAPKKGITGKHQQSGKGHSSTSSFAATVETSYQLSYTWASLTSALSSSMGVEDCHSLTHDHPLCALYTGNLTGVSKLGLALLGAMQGLYEVALPHLTAFIQRSVEIPADAKDRFDQTIRQIRKSVLLTVKALIALSSTALESMKRTLEIEGRGQGVSEYFAQEWLSNGSASWFEWLQSSVTNASAEQCGGALLADLQTVFRGDILSIIQLTSDSPQRSDYLIQSLGSLKGFVSSALTEGRNATFDLEERIQKSLSLESETGTNVALSTDAGGSSSNRVTVAVNSIKTIFPSYGAVFIIACLKEFNFDLDLTLDALLSDNLSPQLARLDRTLEQVHIGKASLKTALSESETSIFLEKQKERIRAQEREEEENYRVIREEYNDDYDDQFDDIVQVSVSANDGSTFTEDPDDRHTANSTLSKKAARKAGVVKVGPTPAINWDVKMRDMKRLNTLIKAEEEEQQFWASIKNTNRLSSIVEVQEDDDRAIQPTGEVPTPGLMNPSHQSGGRRFGKDDGGRGRGASRYGGKSYDKAHHERKREQTKASAGGSIPSANTTNGGKPHGVEGGMKSIQGKDVPAPKSRPKSDGDNLKGGVVQKADLAYRKG